MMANGDERAIVLDQIRRTYAEYRSDGRARIWSERNPGYRRLLAERDRALTALIRSDELPAGSRLLDVGCGEGGLAALVGVACPGVEVIGIDLLPDRIEIARQRFPDATFIVGSADDIPIRSASIDVAAALTLFSSIPSPALERLIAEELNRVVRPGGSVLWYDLRHGNPWNKAVHGVSAGRLNQLFPNWTIDVRPISLMPPLARHLGRLTPVLYPVLDRVRPLRSHLVGQLTRPG
jgi:SAM-dependent methyltransferase